MYSILSFNFTTELSTSKVNYYYDYLFNFVKAKIFNKSVLILLTFKIKH